MVFQVAIQRNIVHVDEVEADDFEESLTFLSKNINPIVKRFGYQSQGVTNRIINFQQDTRAFN